MPGRKKVIPYHLVLRVLNFGISLSERDEACLGDDPGACLMYARKVLKGRLPDHLHNRMVLGVWEDEADREAVRAYLKDFAGKT